ncbi:protein ALEX-like [Drosophila teissieri]|uniref:protein ALEX-like n=1 Tax=Drosophila teissieri TaxID=7243 RepID=UPI001CBA3328|nr:protein ALEX-like [Drosophila teissieri]
MREELDLGLEPAKGAEVPQAGTDSYLQLLASPLVSRSPSSVQEDPEEVPDMDLSEETVAEGPIAYVSLSSESEEDDGGETVTPEVSSDEDERDRIARARIRYRSVRRATQDHGRIRLVDAMPSRDLEELLEFANSRNATLRRFERMVPQPPLPPTPPPPSQPPPTPQPPSPVPQQQEQPQPPTPPPAQPHPPPRTPTPPPAPSTPPPQDEEGPR